jgi:transposase
MWLMIVDRTTCLGSTRLFLQIRRSGIESVSMDMWPAYIRVTLDAIPYALEKIAFDKYHVAKCLGDAVDKVRQAEHRDLLADGRDDLTRTRHHWLMNTQNMGLNQWRGFKAVSKAS